MENFNSQTTQATIIEPQKNSKKILWAIIIILVIVIGLGVYFYIIGSKDFLSPEEILVQEQKAELDRLSQQAGARPLTAQEIETQTKALNVIQEQARSIPFTQAQIKQQSQSLNEAKKQSLLNQ